MKYVYSVNIKLNGRIRLLGNKKPFSRWPVSYRH